MKIKAPFTCENRLVRDVIQLVDIHELRGDKYFYSDTLILPLQELPLPNAEHLDDRRDTSDDGDLHRMDSDFG